MQRRIEAASVGGLGQTFVVKPLLEIGSLFNEARRQRWVGTRLGELKERGSYFPSVLCNHGIP